MYKQLNAKSIIKTGGSRPELPSMRFADLIAELDAENFEWDSVVTTHSDNLNQDRIVLGVSNADGYIDYTKKYVSIRISSKLQVKAINDIDKFNEFMDNYPVFFGVSKIKSTPEEIEDGADEIREVSWVTVAPAGEYKPRKASKVDVKALLGKGKVAGFPTV